MGVFSLLCVCLFVCTVTDFSATEKDRPWNFACMFDYYPDSSSPILVNFGSRGVTAAALLPGCMRPLTGCRRRLPVRLGGDSELGAVARWAVGIRGGGVAQGRVLGFVFLWSHFRFLWPACSSCTLHFIIHAFFSPSHLHSFLKHVHSIVSCVAVPL